MTETAASPSATEMLGRFGPTSMFRQGSGRPVLVLHAAGGAGAWNDYLELLSGHYDVIAPDHPGFGHSEALDQVKSMATLVDHYLSVLDALGIDQVDLVGASFGGWIAAELASTAPARVRRLVLMAPAGLHLPETPPANLFEMTPVEVVRALFKDQAKAQAMLSQPLSSEAAAMAARDDEAFHRFAADPFLHNPALAGRLPAITAPTLVLAAEVDQVIPRAHSDAYAAAIPGAVVRVVPDCGHALYFERPEYVANAVISFLDGSAP